MRVTSLKEFCESAEVEYQKILGYGKTRFLEMLTCVNSILRVYDGLKGYFSETQKSPVILKDFFKNPYSKLWLIFVRDQVNKYFLKYVMRIFDEYSNLKLIYID